MAPASVFHDIIVEFILSKAERSLPIAIGFIFIPLGIITENLSKYYPEEYELL